MTCISCCLNLGLITYMQIFSFFELNVVYIGQIPKLVFPQISHSCSGFLNIWLWSGSLSWETGSSFGVLMP